MTCAPPETRAGAASCDLAFEVGAGQARRRLRFSGEHTTPSSACARGKTPALSTCLRGAHGTILRCAAGNSPRALGKSRATGRGPGDLAVTSVTSLPILQAAGQRSRRAAVRGYLGGRRGGDAPVRAWTLECGAPGASGLHQDARGNRRHADQRPARGQLEPAEPLTLLAAPWRAP